MRALFASLPIFLLLLGVFAMTTADAAPKPLITLARGLRFPEGPVLSPDGKMLYVVNVQSSAISRLNLKTGALTLAWVTLPGEGRGNGATWGPDGALYVADVGGKRIVRVAPADGAVATLVDKTGTGAAFRGPNDLVFDKQGGLYFTDPDGSWDQPIASVYYVAPKTHAVSVVADGLQFPNGLVLSAVGDTLFVGESPLHRITAIDLTLHGLAAPGRRRVFATVATMGGPDGMRLGRDGFLYAAIYGEGVIAKISPQGTVVRRYLAGGKNPTNLCFSRDGRFLYVTETETNSIVRLTL